MDTETHEKLCKIGIPRAWNLSNGDKAILREKLFGAVVMLLPDALLSSPTYRNLPLERPVIENGTPPEPHQKHA
jgi:hypothetical protein